MQSGNTFIGRSSSFAMAGNCEQDIGPFTAIHCSNGARQSSLPQTGATLCQTLNRPAACMMCGCCERLWQPGCKGCNSSSTDCEGRRLPHMAVKAKDVDEQVQEVGLYQQQGAV
jgi:hypothetical protein